MKGLLQRKRTLFGDDMLKPALYAVIERFKHNKVQYPINSILEAARARSFTFATILPRIQSH
jgi:hypothetical protein